MATTSIEWTATTRPDGSVSTGKTWNPVTGCNKVSQGCKYCYAEVMAECFKTMAQMRLGRFYLDTNNLL